MEPVATLNGPMGPRGAQVYLATARASFRQQSTYRAATVAGAFTNTVFGFVLAGVLQAAYNDRAASGSSTVGALDRTSAITFTFVAQGLLAVMGAFGWREVAERVRTGDIAVDLYRPVSFSGWWASVWAGRAAFAFVARGLPPFLVGALVYHLRLPAQASTWPAFLVSVAIGTMVGSRLWLAVNLLAFWVVEIRGMVILTVNVLILAAGFAIPLQFVTGWPGALCRASPFAALAQFPIEVFLELRPGWRAWLPQLAWLVALEAGVRGLLATAMRKVVIQGG